MNLGYMTALAAQAAGSPSGAQQGPNSSMMIMMLAMIFVLFYFIILRPQKREQKRQQEIRESVEKGDKVVTIGGVHGAVASVDKTNNTVSVQVDKNVKITFSREAIHKVIKKEEARETADES